MHLLLDIERRRGDHQIGPILLVFAAPYQLRIEIAIAPLIRHAQRALLLLAHHRLVFRRRDVLAGSLVMRQSDDGPLDLRFWGLGGHWGSLRYGTGLGGPGCD